MIGTSPLVQFYVYLTDSKQTPNLMKQGGFIYILTNNYNTVLYTGVTSDLSTRLILHQSGIYSKVKLHYCYSCTAKANILITERFYYRLSAKVIADHFFQNAISFAMKNPQMPHFKHDGLINESLDTGKRSSVRTPRRSISCLKLKRRSP